MPEYVIHTDGACSGNPGAGGWGAVICSPEGDIHKISGGDPHTTNNRMELLAAISALEHIPQRSNAVLYTDSRYLKNGITDWIQNWKKNSWKTSDSKPVKNRDLWMRLDRARYSRKVLWKWVKGHDGDLQNEEADELARKGLEESRNPA